MPRLLALLAAVAVLVVAVPAHAQSWEASGLLGYTPSVGLERRAPEVNQLDIRGGFTWGVQAAYFFTPHWGAEVLWSRQSSALEIGANGGSAALFQMTVGELQGNAVYRFGPANARLQPFAFGGLGATFLRATDVQSETKPSWGIGGGIKYFPWKTIGVRGHVRYKPTKLNDKSSGDFCDPFGFCQATLGQFEIMAGAAVRF